MPRVPLLSILLSAALLLAPAAARADVTPEFFDLPAGNNVQGGIAVDGDGSIWVPSGRTFGEPTIARLIPAQAAAGTANGTATFPTPTIRGTSCCANMTRSVAYEPEKRRVWFVQSDGIIGWADPAQVQPGRSSGMSAVLVRTPIRGSAADWTPDLWDVAAAPRGGNVWFTERSTYNVEPYPGARIAWFNKDVGVPNELANIALQGGARTLSPTRYDAKPSGIAVDADGKPWFAESDPGNPGWRIGTPRGGGPDYDEYLVTPCAPRAPCSGSFTGTGITDVAVAADRSIWFTNELRNEFGRLDVANATFTSYSLPAVDPAFTGGRPMAIAAAPDGTLWLAQYGGISHPNGNAIVKIAPDPLAPTATVWKLGAAQYPMAVTADAGGSIWFAVNTNSGPGQIGRLAGVLGGGGGTPGGGTPGGGTPGGGSPGGGTPGGGTPGGGAIPGGGGPVVRPLVPATVGVARPGTPSTAGDSMSIDQICVGPPEAKCSLVYIISAGEYVSGFPGSRSDDRDRSRAVTAVAAATKGRAKPRPRKRARAVILGQKVVTLRGGQRAKVRVTLNAKGRALLRRAGRLKLFVTVTERGANGAGKRIKAVRVVFRRPPARRSRRR